MKMHVFLKDTLVLAHALLTSAGFFVLTKLSCKWSVCPISLSSVWFFVDRFFSLDPRNCHPHFIGWSASLSFLCFSLEWAYRSCISNALLYASSAQLDFAEVRDGRCGQRTVPHITCTLVNSGTCSAIRTSFDDRTNSIFIWQDTLLDLNCGRANELCVSLLWPVALFKGYRSKRSLLTLLASLNISI